MTATAQAAKTTTGKSFINRFTDGFQNLVAKLGIGGDNQMSGGHYSYGPFLSRNRQELEAAYRSSWVVGAVVDTIAEDMTRAKAEIVSGLKPEQITTMNNAFERMAIWHNLCNAIKWARLFGGGLAVIMVDGQNMSMPLRLDRIGKGQFKGLMVLDRWLVNPPMSAMVQEYGPSFGMPMFYDVIGDAIALKNVSIHYSRVIRFDGIELPWYQKVYENMWGESVIERMYDRLLAFDSATHGAAQLVFKAHLRTIGVEGLREALSMGGKAEEVVIKQFEYIRLMQSNEGLTLLDSKDTFNTHQYTFSGLSDMMLQFAQHLSGATGIPLVRLLGQSPAGLNSTGESDLRNYYDNVNKLQENQMRLGLMKLYRIVAMSELGLELPDDFTFNFNPLWQLQDKEKADLAKVDSEGVNDLYNSGIFTRKQALKELKQASRTTGRFSNITDEDIEAADDTPQEKGEALFGKALPGFEGKEPGKEEPPKKEDKAE